MAGPSITVAVLADTDDARRELKKVGTTAEDMGRDVESGSRKARAGLDDIDNGAGNTERGLRGLNDGFSGATSIMATFGLAAGGTVGTTVALVAGFTDLAGFVGDFATQIPPLLVKMGLLTAATEGETGAQYALNTAFLVNPIFLVVAAIVALTVVIVALWMKSETFRQVVTGAFNAVKDTAMDVYTWIRDHWPLLLAIITGPFGLAVREIIIHRDAIVDAIMAVPDKLLALPGKMLDKGKEFGKALVAGVVQGVRGLGSALAGAVDFADDMARQVADAIKSFVNTQIIDRFNRAVEIDVSFLGKSIGIDPRDVPHLASGGRVTGPASGYPAILHGTEMVIPLQGRGAASGFGNTYITYMPNPVTPSAVDDAQRRYSLRNG